MAELVNTSTIAKILEISDRQVRRLIDRGVLSAEVDGLGHYRLDPETAQDEYEAYTGADVESVAYWREQIDKADAAIKEATADVREMELAELRGEVHRVDFVTDLMIECILAERSAAMALPGKLAPVIAGMTDEDAIAELIQREVDAIQIDLSRFGYNPVYYAQRVAEEGGDTAAPDEQEAAR